MRLVWRGKPVLYLTKLFILVVVGLLLPVQVFAFVGSGTASDNNYKMTYPIVYLENNQYAQDKINSDLYHYIASFKDDYYSGKIISGSFNYDVKFEDSQYVSIMIKESRYIYAGAAHGMIFTNCVTYDKKTGNRLDLPYFVKLGTDDLVTILNMTLYDASDKVIPHSRSFVNEYLRSGNAKISDNYYLAGGGRIALVYPPYALAAFAFGPTHIIIDSTYVDYFNRKNP